MKNIILLLTFSTSFSAIAQQTWNWTVLAPMPKRVSNNAVVEATVGGVPYVYSFTGIDSTKSPNGLNLGAYRYNTQTAVWETLPDVPDTLGKIAAGASTINNIIYVIGGYHVLPSFNEISSTSVHRYDSDNSMWLSDGAPIPVPIDDHVQAVWRDSLIYVITGWSNSGNVPTVQVYNPALDVWSFATPTPDNNNYKCFGASGAIIGDTIFYNGGASAGINFPGRKHLRRGIIDANDPSQITWDKPTDNPGDAGYRMAATTHENNVFWIGGSGTTYNFDGQAYNGTGGVEPLTRILRYNSETAQWQEGLGAPYSVMDLRGVAKIGPAAYIICGGMSPGQTVSNETYLITLDTLALNIPEQTALPLKTWPNPSNGTVFLDIPTLGTLKIHTIEGKLISEEKVSPQQNFQIELKTAGQYIVSLQTSEQVFTQKITVQGQ